MADVAVDPENNNPKELLSQGIRAYYMQDYSAAVTALSKASELLAIEHGDDLHESLANVYLYYGKSLLGLSRETSEALGDAVPKNADEDSEDEEQEDDDENEPEENNKDENNEAGDAQEASSTTENEPSTSTGISETNNDEKEGDDEPTDLQVAWEVLELAKKIYKEKFGDNGLKNLAETLIVLGEISLESENFESAVTDIKEGLDIQRKLFSADSRTIAETFYKLGIAYSSTSQIDEAIKSFKSSLECLHNRIHVLQKTDNTKNEDEDEIKEIRNLIPDIEEKINDMQSYMEEAIKKKLSELVNEPEKRPSNAEGASSSKQVTNISHLVKRKRKIDEVTEEKEEENRPVKKPPT